MPKASMILSDPAIPKLDKLPEGWKRTVGAETEAHFSNVISTKSVSDYARRIREALGLGERDAQ